MPPIKRLPRISSQALRPRIAVTQLQGRPSIRTATTTAQSPATADEKPLPGSDLHHLSTQHEVHGEHESEYDPPGGWLWGIRPGEKYEKEGWEGLFIYGFGGTVIAAGIAYAFKEDTS